MGGIFGGFVGLGGGAIMIPFMVDILKLDQHKAHGTNLVTIVFTGIAGAIAYGLGGAIDVTAAVLLAVPAILTTRAGCHFAHSLPAWKLKRYFGYFLIFMSLLLLAKSYLPRIHGLETGWPQAAVLLSDGRLPGISLRHVGRWRWNHHGARHGAAYGFYTAHRTGDLASRHGPYRQRRRLYPLETWQREDRYSGGHDCGDIYRGCASAGHLPIISRMGPCGSRSPPCLYGQERAT